MVWKDGLWCLLSTKKVIHVVVYVVQCMQNGCLCPLPYVNNETFSEFHRCLIWVHAWMWHWQMLRIFALMLYSSLMLCLCIQISSFVVSVLRLLFIIILHGNDGNQLWLPNIFLVSGAVRVLVGTNNIHASSTIYGRSILSLYIIEKDSILKMSSNRQSSVLRLHNLAWCQYENCHYILYSNIS